MNFYPALYLSLALPRECRRLSSGPATAKRFSCGTAIKNSIGLGLHRPKLYLRLMSLINPQAHPQELSLINKVLTGKLTGLQLFLPLAAPPLDQAQTLTCPKASAGLGTRTTSPTSIYFPHRSSKASLKIHISMANSSASLTAPLRMKTWLRKYVSAPLCYPAFHSTPP